MKFESYSMDICGDFFVVWRYIRILFIGGKVRFCVVCFGGNGIVCGYSLFRVLDGCFFDCRVVWRLFKIIFIFFVIWWLVVVLIIFCRN